MGVSWWTFSLVMERGSRRADNVGHLTMSEAEINGGVEIRGAKDGRPDVLVQLKGRKVHLHQKLEGSKRVGVCGLLSSGSFLLRRYTCRLRCGPLGSCEDSGRSTCSA